MNNSTAEQRAISVLAFPAFSNRNSNSYNADLYSEVTRHNIKVTEFSFYRAIFKHNDIIHIHWPEKFLNSNYRIKAILWSAALLFCLTLHRMRGGKVVWTAHNLIPHQIKYHKLYKIFIGIFRSRIDAVISLSESNRHILEKNVQLPNLKHHAVIPHHLYPVPDTDNISIPATLPPLPENFCLFFGRLLPYKNVETIIDIFTRNPPSNLNLIIAGAAENQTYAQSLTAHIGKSNRITFINRRISDAELATLIHNCRFGVLPFKTIFNSGSLLQFASYGKAVLTPYSESFAEYAAFFSPSPFIFYHNDVITSQTIKDTAANISGTTYPRPVQLSLENCGRLTAEFFRAVASS